MVAGSDQGRARPVALLLAAGVILALSLWFLSGDVGLRPDDPEAPEEPAEVATIPDLAPVSGGEPEEQEEEVEPEKAGPAEQAAGGPFTVVVVGPGQRPLEGVLIRPSDWSRKESVKTGSDGRAELTWGAEEAELTIRTSGIAPDRHIRLKDRETVLRFPDLIPLTVEVVDGVSGRTLSGAAVSLRRPGGPDLVLEPRTGKFELEISPLRRGHNERLRFTVTPPSGHLADPLNPFAVSATISRFAVRAHARLALWPEVPLSIIVSDHEGRPASGASVSAISVGGKSIRTRSSPAGADGRVLVRGVPGLRGERVTGSAASADGLATMGFELRIDDFHAPLTARVALPPPRPLGTARNLIGMGGGAGGAFGGRGGRRSLSFGRCALYVHVLRRDGRPAKNALVRLRGPAPPAAPRGAAWTRSDRADDFGRVVFRGLVAGPVTVTVSEVGFLSPAPVSLDLSVEGATVTIREAWGRSLQILVLDATGLPVPHARITLGAVAGKPYACLIDDVQHLNLVTDRDGRCPLPDLAEGKVAVTAVFGSRRATVSARSGDALTITLPR